MLMSVLDWTATGCLLCFFQLRPNGSFQSLGLPGGAGRNQFAGKSTRSACQWPGVESWGAPRLCQAHTRGWPQSTSADPISAPALWSRLAGWFLLRTASSASKWWMSWKHFVFWKQKHVVSCSSKDVWLKSPISSWFLEVVAERGPHSWRLLSCHLAIPTDYFKKSIQFEERKSVSR